MKKLFFIVIGILVGLWTIPGVVGALTDIPDPTAEYLAATTYIDFSSVPQYSFITSITDGTQTVSFGSAMEKRFAPGGGWATWSEAPYSQRQPDETLPVVLSGSATDVLFTLSTPATVFGFEAEPDPFAVHEMTAYYYSAYGVYLGQISRDVDGYAGARLFAASAIPIGYVYFESDTDWAAGAFRYATPEPSVLVLLGAGLIGLVGLRRKFWN